MPIEIHVSRAAQYDASSMAMIHKTCFAKPWDETAMAKFLASPEVLCLVGSVADDSGGVMGGMLIARKAACRRSGLGRALLEVAISALRESGTKQLFLEVDKGNEAALALYRALGAQPVGRRAGYYEDGADAAIFSLAL